MDLSAEQQERLILLDRAHGIQELLRGVAHAIRNNMQVVTLASQLEDERRTPAIVMQLEQAIDAINRHLDLLGSFGRQVSDGPQTVALADLVVLVEQAIHYQRSHRSTAVRFGPCPALVLALPPAAGLQLLGNLISNAREADPNRPIEVGFERNGAMVEITIDDGGPGLPPGAGRPLESIRPTGSHGGTGLFAAREVARAHRGSLEWSARPEGGTRMTIRLPIDGAGR
jgi:signal transduction histidine kinase